MFIHDEKCKIIEENSSIQYLMQTLNDVSVTFSSLVVEVENYKLNNY